MTRFSHMGIDLIFEYVEAKLRSGFKLALSKNHGLRKGRIPLSNKLRWCGPFSRTADFDNFVPTFAKNFADGICPNIERSACPPGMGERHRVVKIGVSEFSIVIDYNHTERGVFANIFWVEVGDEDPWNVPPMLEVK